MVTQDIKKEGRSQILFLFLPGFSTKKRFDALSSGKVNWWVKEAELWWFPRSCRVFVAVRSPSLAI